MRGWRRPREGAQTKNRAPGTGYTIPLAPCVGSSGIPLLSHFQAAEVPEAVRFFFAGAVDEPGGPALGIDHDYSH